MAKTLNIYSAKNLKSTTMPLPKEFSEPMNADILAQAIHVYADRMHPGNSRTKTRGEMNMTKAKVYSQKGTGNARHGAKSAPIFVGGGKAHGPKGIKRTLEMPVKMRRKALSVAWSAKNGASKLAVVSDLDSVKSTKAAQDLVTAVEKGQGSDGWKKMTLFLSDSNKEAHRFFKNIKSVVIEKYSNANAYSVYRGGFVMVDEEALPKTKVKTTTTKKTK